MRLFDIYLYFENCQIFVWFCLTSPWILTIYDQLMILYMWRIAIAADIARRSPISFVCDNEIHTFLFLSLFNELWKSSRDPHLKESLTSDLKYNFVHTFLDRVTCSSHPFDKMRLSPNVSDVLKQCRSFTDVSVVIYPVSYSTCADICWSSVKIVSERIRSVPAGLDRS